MTVPGGSFDPQYNYSDGLPLSGDPEPGVADYIQGIVDTALAESGEAVIEAAVLSGLSSKADLATLNNTTKAGFWSDIDASPPKITRLRDRVFVGNATLNHDTRNGNNSTWLGSGASASWAPRDAQFISMADNGALALVGASRVSDHDLGLASTPACIGVAGFVISDGTIQKPAWALYADIQHEPNPAAPAQSYGLEVAAKNKGADYTHNPYALTFGVSGVWLAGGGDDTYGGAPANPSNTAIVVLKNDHTWNKGIVFGADALTGTDGVDTGTATAIDMAKNHQIRWSKPDGTAGAVIRSGVSTTNKSITVLFLDDRILFGGTSAAPILDLLHSTGAVNSLEVRNSLATLSPSISARGSDTNIDIAFTPKGSGAVRFGTLTANADAAITGYITIKDSSGTTRKLAVIA